MTGPAQPTDRRGDSASTTAQRYLCAYTDVQLQANARLRTKISQLVTLALEVRKQVTSRRWLETAANE